MPEPFGSVDVVGALFDVLVAYDVPSKQVVDEFLRLCNDPAYAVPAAKSGT